MLMLAVLRVSGRASHASLTSTVGNDRLALQNDDRNVNLPKTLERTLQRDSGDESSSAPPSPPPRDRDDDAKRDAEKASGEVCEARASSHESAFDATIGVRNSTCPFVRS